MVTCETCRFWRAPSRCHRHPVDVKAGKGHWCGEYQTVETEAVAPPPWRPVPPGGPIAGGFISGILRSEARASVALDKDETLSVGPGPGQLQPDELAPAKDDDPVALLGGVTIPRKKKGKVT